MKTRVNEIENLGEIWVYTPCKAFTCTAQETFLLKVRCHSSKVKPFHLLYLLAFGKRGRMTNFRKLLNTFSHAMLLGLARPFKRQSCRFNGVMKANFISRKWLSCEWPIWTDRIKNLLYLVTDMWHPQSWRKFKKKSHCVNVWYTCKRRGDWGRTYMKKYICIKLHIYLVNLILLPLLETTTCTANTTYCICS